MNKRIRSVFFLLLLLGVAGRLMAQQGFGTNAPASTAVVEMKSDTRGVLFPRVELKGNNDKQTILNPAKYLLVFNTKAAGGLGTEVIPGFYCWDGNNWIRLLVPDNFSFWHTAGDNGTTPTNFFGTLDEKDLIMKTNNLERMRITAGGTVSLASSNQIPQKNSVNASAVMELKSTNQGFLLPRMTTDQLYAIANPTNGLLVYDKIQNYPIYFADSLYIRADRSTVIRPAALGNTYTNFYNGIWNVAFGTTITTGYTGSEYIVTSHDGEVFSNNTDCQTQLISAGGCGGAVAVKVKSGNTYPLVEINGQCWFAQDLHEKPSAFPTAPAWSNVDNGSYDVTKNLYQWKAAMNAATSERSRGICPTGFHIPSDCEFMYLAHGLGTPINIQKFKNIGGQHGLGGMSNQFVNKLYSGGVTGFSFTYATIYYDSYLKKLWSPSSSEKYFWTSTSIGDGSKLTMRLVANDYYNVPGSTYLSPSYGMYVRCLKD